MAQSSEIKLLKRFDQDVEITGNIVIGGNFTNNINIVKNNVGIPTTYSTMSIEATDAQLDLISSASGTWGSSINLVEGTSSTANTNVWSIARQTSGAGNLLRFNFGAGNQHDNAAMMSLSTGGNLTLTGTLSASGYNKSNWDTAYGWGNHADAGYLTSIAGAREDNGGELPSAANLNDLIDNGLYGQNSNSQATTANNYPTTYAGILETLNDPGNGYHTSQMYFKYNGNNDIFHRYRYDTSGGNGGWSDWAKIWTSRTDGSGSGLDADTLDGYHASSFLTSLPSHTHSASDITSGTLSADRLPWANNDGFTGTYPLVWKAANTPYTASWLNVNGTTDVLHTRGITADGTVTTNRIVSSNTSDSADVVGGIAFIRSFDGSGDYVSSIDSLGSYIVSKTDGQYGGGTKPPGSHNGLGIISLQTHTGNYYTQLGLSTATNELFIRSANNSSTFAGWTKIWHQSNDGAGSSLDADLLDGLQGSSYLRSDASDTFSGDYLGFSGLSLGIANNNSSNGYNTYFRGDGTHFVLGLTNGNTLYLNYGNSNGSLRTYGTMYHENTFWMDTSRNITVPTANIGGILLEDSSDRGGLLEVNRKGTSSWSGIQIVGHTKLWSLMGSDTYIGAYNDTDGQWAWLYTKNANIDFYYGASIEAGTRAGYFLANNQMRSPIFYDSNDTGYYVNPADTGMSARLAGRMELVGSAPVLEMNDSNASNTTQLVSYISFQRQTSERGYVGYGSSGNDYFYVRNADGVIYNYGSYTLHAGSSRAPIFYDSDNSSYFVNPATTGDAFYTQGRIRQTNQNNSTWPYQFVTSSVGNDNHSGFWVGSNGYPDMRLRRENSTVRALISSWERSFTTFGFTDSTDVRSPIFYDVNNTGYYIHGDSTSRLNLLNVNAVGTSVAGVGKVMFPYGAEYNSGSTTGAIKITLPQSWTNTMMTMKITIFDYSINESFEVHCGGYNHTGSGGYWVNTHAKIIANPHLDRNFNVRFGHDGSKCCILIGETNSAWAYPKVVVTEWVGGHSNETFSNWDNGWDISIVTTLPSNIDQTRSNNQLGRTTNLLALPYYNGGEMYLRQNTHWDNVSGIDVIGGAGEFRFSSNTGNLNVRADGWIHAHDNMKAPIFYDSGNTAYYINGDSTSRLYDLNVTHFGIANTSSTSRDGISLYGGPTGGVPTYGILFTGTSLGTHGSVTGSWATYLTMSNNTDRGWVFRRGSTNVASIGGNGNGTFNGDVIAYYSDMRLKTKLGDIEDPIGKIQALNGFYYEPNEVAESYGYEKETRVGLSAQDVEAVLPEIVTDAPIGDGYKTVDYAKLVPVLVEAIKEQQKQIDELKKLINP